MASTAGALLARLALEPVWGTELPYVTLFPAIMLSAWLGGLGPGLLSTALSAVGAAYFWLEPSRTLGAGNPAGILGLLVFLGVGVGISGLNEASRRAVAALADAEESLRTTRAEAASAEERLRLALDAGRMGTWEWTLATGRVHWSSGLEAIHGLAPGTFPGTFDAVQREVHPDDRALVAHAIEQALAGAAPYHVEYRIVRIDRAVRWVEGRGQVFHDDSGTPSSMMGVCTDITDRKQAEEALKDADRRKDEFLAVLSHELRNPINAVVGWAQILKSGGLTADKVRHGLDVIERNARAEAQLVESLLDLSRISTGKLDLEARPVDLRAVVTAAVENARPVARTTEVGLELQAPPEPLEIVGDSARLEQVLSNLLSNAIKFTPRAGHVRVLLDRSDGQARIRVSDDGEGIAPAFLPFVFDRFRQADSSRERQYGGLGLGLSVVRELVHAHGGTVTAESAGPGRGSTFTVHLPAEHPLDAGTGRAAGVGDASPAVIHGLRILVVDDDADARELLLVALTAYGAAVRTAPSAAAGLDVMRQHPIDVLVADIGMPDEDGYSLVRRVRQRERAENLGRLPAIAVTAFAAASDREQAVGAGFDLHVPKPVDPDSLVRAIASISPALGV